jgi:hypothetical protein
MMKMTKTTFLIISVCISILGLESCKKQAEDVITINTENLEYFLFKKGTCWIYKDSATNNEDSVYIISDTRSIYVDKGIARSVEYERMEIGNSGGDTVFTSIGMSSNHVAFSFSQYGCAVSFVNPDQRNRVSDITVGSLVYSNVIKAQASNLEAYFVEGIGLVKLYIKSDSSTVRKCLELDHYKIIR